LVPAITGDGLIDTGHHLRFAYAAMLEKGCVCNA
jgi:hypothetical protein